MRYPFGKIQNKRIILHFDLDAFFAAVEERENPHFQGKPVVVGAEPHSSAGKGKGRGVVSTANYEARKFGVHSAMPISKAYQLCPQAIFLPVNGGLYAKISENIMQMAEQLIGPLEAVSLDEAYADVSFANAYSEAEKLGRKLKEQIIKKERLVCSVGVGPNKMMAKIACEAGKPDGLFVIKEQDAENYVEGLPIKKIPGIGIKTAEVFKGQGVSLVKDAKRFSLEELRKQFGKRGEDFYEHFRGIDRGVVQSQREVKSIGKEHTFERDTRDSEDLMGIFEELLDEVFEEIEGHQVQCKTITVVCRFQGFETHTKSKTFGKALRKEEFNSEAKRLLLRFIVEYMRPIRLIGIRAAAS